MDSQSFYPSSSHKQLDRLTYTDTHTHNDHIDSNFNRIHNDLTTQAIQKNLQFTDQFNLSNQKPLTKVRSMPQKLFTQQNYQQARAQFEDQVGMGFRITDPNNTAQYGQFNTLSPIPNRVKAYELNQTMNTNVQSRQFGGHTPTPNKTPKMIQKPTSGFLPHLRYELQAPQKNPMITLLTQQNDFPVSNQKVSFQNNTTIIPQIIRGEENITRSPSMAIVNMPSANNLVRTSFNVLKSNIVPFESRNMEFQSRNVRLESQNIHKSNLTAAETRRQYESILVDQQGNQVVNGLIEQPQKQNKFSFISDTVEIPKMATVQEYQEVQIQRPNYRKIYNQKGEYYRTAGPQHDYYKEEVTCCSKMLPALGVLALILLVAGTLAGIGALTGLIGSKNYLSRGENQSRENIIDADTIEKLPIVAPSIETAPIQTHPIINPVVNNSLVTQPSGASQSIMDTQPTSTIIVPVQPSTTLTETLVIPTESYVQSVVPTVPATQPNIQPTIVPAAQPVFQPIFIQPIAQPVTSPVILPINQASQSKPLQNSQANYILQTVTVITKPTQNGLQPTSVQYIKPNPVFESPLTNPITQPSKPTETTVIKPITTPTTIISPIAQQAVPISPEQAQKVIGIIMQNNNQVIPLNFQTSIKQDILNEFQTVPLNFRDFHQLQALTYKHIHQHQTTYEQKKK